MATKYYNKVVDFIENANDTYNFWNRIRSILLEAENAGQYPEDWEIKRLQRLASIKYNELDAQLSREQNEKQQKIREQLGRNLVETKSACRSRYNGYTALVGVDEKIYLGKSEKYLYNEQNAFLSGYDNTDKDLIFVSDNHAMYDLLYSSGSVLTQKECINQGFYTDDDYKELARVQNEVVNGLECKNEYTFNDMPFAYPNY